MRDKAEKILLPENPFEKIHGHTKIELTDIRTGEKKTIEHDNDFQSGVLANYMRSMGAYNNNPYADATWASQPIWRNLCGGILLFRDYINNSGDEVEYMPAGNQMVANGAFNVTNVNTPVELGSYNSVESSTSGNDSLTFVYDWGTSQGNGTISCVCLTTEIGGYIGYGNPSGVAHATTKAFSANQSSNSLSGIVYDNKRWTFSVNASTKEIAVTKTPTEVTKGSIFDNIAEDTIVVTYTGTPTYTAGLYSYYLGNGKVGFFGHSSVSGNYTSSPINNGETFSYIIYDLTTDTASVESIINTTGVTLSAANRQQGVNSNNVVMDNSHIILPSTSNIAYAIKLSDNTYVNTGMPFNYSNTFGAETGGIKGGELCDGLMFWIREENVYIYDKTSGIAYITNGNSTGSQNMNFNDNIMRLSNRSNIYRNPLILSTVNNLDSPVTKTAAQTMKVTYTLTKASE